MLARLYPNLGNHELQMLRKELAVLCTMALVYVLLQALFHLWSVALVPALVFVVAVRKRQKMSSIPCQVLTAISLLIVVLTIPIFLLTLPNPDGSPQMSFWLFPLVWGIFGVYRGVLADDCMSL